MAQGTLGKAEWGRVIKQSNPVPASMRFTGNLFSATAYIS